jgi:hypothetical protein
MMSAPNTVSGPCLARTSSQNRIVSVAQVAPLHALEDQVIAGLERQMQMRHQARSSVANRVHQIVIRFDGIDR